MSLFIDLSDPAKYEFNKTYSAQLYFLETQRLVRANKNLPLKSELEPKVDYWLVTGAIGSGKSSVAKYISTEFGFKLLEF